MKGERERERKTLRMKMPLCQTTFNLCVIWRPGKSIGRGASRGLYGKDLDPETENILETVSNIFCLQTFA